MFDSHYWRAPGIRAFRHELPFDVSQRVIASGVSQWHSDVSAISDTVQAPSAPKARDLVEELEQAANTPLPDDENDVDAKAEQQTDNAGGAAAEQVGTPP